ncbi:hypothetical protein PV04_00062 [Phialophora macrospora]|uniref:Uncharacterized protein n=1 Tax=Phialophora macrospora TaxID=1851006 RepID=A0A0D2FZC1_9EURO|nr:hypothetical protein PV04_00062 [Phialophora macrospora]
MHITNALSHRPDLLVATQRSRNDVFRILQDRHLAPADHHPEMRVSSHELSALAPHNQDFRIPPLRPPFPTRASQRFVIAARLRQQSLRTAPGKESCILEYTGVEGKRSPN